MFTGLIETRGRLKRISRSGEEARLWIEPLQGFQDVRPGDSVCVNGACLTVENRQGNAVCMYASGETLSATNLGRMSGGGTVNLERSLPVGGRLDGHFVTGHVDCLGGVISIAREGESRKIRVSFPQNWARYVVDKGSIALDGISLTVLHAESDFLEVNIIPSTLTATSIEEWRVGWMINLEFDILAKYVQRMLSGWQGKGAGQEEGISQDFLQRHGFR